MSCVPEGVQFKAVLDGAGGGGGGGGGDLMSAQRKWLKCQSMGEQREVCGRGRESNS